MTPANDEAFFREVDDELRRSQVANIWERHGRMILIGIVVFLALLAAWLFWQHRRAAAHDARAEQFSTAVADLSENKEPAARTALAALAKDGDDYGRAARLTRAGLAMAKGDLKAAAAGYAAIAADDAAPQPVRDLATIRGTAAAFETLPPAQVIARLKPLAVPGGPWFPSAAEMTALAWLRLNQPGKAGPLFAGLARDKSVPETLRARAVRISGMLGVDGVAAAGGAN